MIADQQCTTTWRATRGSFVGLMTLYESTYMRLGWILNDLRSAGAPAVSRIVSDCDLLYLPIDSGPYTRRFRLTYRFEVDGVTVLDPDLEVCVYHDARLAEARSVRGVARHPEIARLNANLKRELDLRWARNMMLNKWLEYCAERGHRF
jgi:uncharacterized protein YqiB (DUF1249 family)